MPKVLVLYCSAYGHTEAMANAVAKATVSRARKLTSGMSPRPCRRRSRKLPIFKLEQTAPVAKVEDLATYDAIIVGAGTRFGRISSPMASFFDQATGSATKMDDPK